MKCIFIHGGWYWVVLSFTLIRTMCGNTFFVCVSKNSGGSTISWTMWRETGGELIDRNIKAGEYFSEYFSFLRISICCTISNEKVYIPWLLLVQCGDYRGVFIFINSRHRSGPDCRNAAVHYTVILGNTNTNTNTNTNSRHIYNEPGFY